MTLLARRFWPYSGGSDTASLAVEIADRFVKAGAHVRVLTPGDPRGKHSRARRYHFAGSQSATQTEHPLRFRHYDVDVPIPSPRGDWAVGRYVRSWCDWISQHCKDSDALISVGAREEAVGLVQASKNLKITSSVLPIAWGPESDLKIWRRTLSRRRYLPSLCQADRCLAVDAESERRLVASGIESQMIERIPEATATISHFESEIGPAPSRATLGAYRQLIRNSLKKVNLDLVIEKEFRVIGTSAEMVRGGTLDSLVEAIPRLNSVHPNHLWWMFGDGPARSRFHDELRAEGVRAFIAMPGCFANDSGMISALDLFIHLDDHPFSGFFRQAIASGIPILASRTPANESYVDRLNRKQIANPIIEWLDLNSTKESPSLFEQINPILSQPSERNLDEQSHPIPTVVQPWMPDWLKQPHRENLDSAYESNDPDHESNKSPSPESRVQS